MITSIQWTLSLWAQLRNQEITLHPKSRRCSKTRDWRKVLCWKEGWCMHLAETLLLWYFHYNKSQHFCKSKTSKYCFKVRKYRSRNNFTGSRSNQVVGKCISRKIFSSQKQRQSFREKMRKWTLKTTHYQHKPRNFED